MQVPYRNRPVAAFARKPGLPPYGSTTGRAETPRRRCVLRICTRGTCGPRLAPRHSLPWRRGLREAGRHPWGSHGQTRIGRMRVVPGIIAGRRGTPQRSPARRTNNAGTERLQARRHRPLQPGSRPLVWVSTIAVEQPGNRLWASRNSTAVAGRHPGKAHAPAQPQRVSAMVGDCQQQQRCQQRRLERSIPCEFGRCVGRQSRYTHGHQDTSRRRFRVRQRSLASAR